jgi:hypothetical protein
VHSFAQNLLWISRVLCGSRIGTGTGQAEFFEITSPHFDRVPQQPFNDSQVPAHSKCAAPEEITI